MPQLGSMQVPSRQIPAPGQRPLGTAIEHLLVSVISMQRPSTQSASPAHRPLGREALHALPSKIVVQVPAIHTALAGQRPLRLSLVQASGGTGPTHCPWAQISQAAQVPAGKLSEQLELRLAHAPALQKRPSGQKPNTVVGEQWISGSSK